METPEEKNQRKLAHKLVSMIPGLHNDKVNLKAKSLIKEMEDYTYGKSVDMGEMEALKSISYSYPPLYKQMYNEFNEDIYEAVPTKLVTFWGFNGMLAQKYSVVIGMSRDEITARLQFAGDKVPYSIKDYSGFMIVVDQMADTPSSLHEISFDDAMNIIRIGIEKLKVVDFEDADEDEFDDNCEATCKPGNHTCGK